MARVRSPNFPAISLGEAIQKVRQVWEKEQRIPAPKDVIARHLGYNGLNGKSLKIISALSKYGLLDGGGGKKMTVSDLAMRILFPKDDADKQAALNEAAFKPSLFQQFRDEWGDERPSHELFRSHLLHRNFAASAVEKVIAAYTATLELVAHDRAQFSSDNSTQDLNVGRDEEVNTGSRAQAGYSSGVAASALPFSINIVPTGLKISADVRDKKTIKRMIELLRAYEPFVNDELPFGNRQTKKAADEAESSETR